MLKKIAKKLTGNYREVPLFYATFDLEKHQESGPKNSCVLKVHPELKDDKELMRKMEEMIDHIRANHDMEKLSK